MRGLDPTHASVDDYQLERRDIGLNEGSPRVSRQNRMPSKQQPGYGDHAITLEEWREAYGA